MSDFKIPDFPVPKTNKPLPPPTAPPPKQDEDKKEDKKEPQQEKEPQAPNPDKIKKYQEILSSIKYSPPPTASPFPDPRYSLEVLKGGSILDKVTFSKMDGKGAYIIGRVPGCDVVAENPTVSRTHAVLQFIQGGGGKEGKKKKKGEDEEDGPPETTGLYIYDLGSTHGTFINKNQVYPRKFYRLRVGHVLKFGSSTRLYIVLGPSDDEEEESDKSVTELQNEKLQRELRKKKLEEEGILIKGSGPEGEVEDPNACAWGMGEDAVEESEERENPFAMNFEESEGFDNPKKTLRGWFEREGEDLVYDCREKAPGQFICRINLPIDGPGGLPVFAEADVKGKKKEAVAQAALQACQILDKYGVLRVSHHESKSKRKQRDWEDQDYYSSDEDTFLDRTGSVEKKREKRMKIAGKLQDKVETFQSLSQKASELQAEIDALNSEIAEGVEANSSSSSAQEGDVDVDDYLNFLKAGGAIDLKKLKVRLREATEELKRVNKLLDITRPASLPPSLSSSSSSKKISSDVKKEIEEFTSPSLSTVKKPQIKISLGNNKDKPSSTETEDKVQGDLQEDKKPVIPPSVSSSNQEDKPPKPSPPQPKLFGPRLPLKPQKVLQEEKEPKKASKNKEETELPKASKLPPNLHDSSESSSGEEEVSSTTTATTSIKKKRPRQRAQKKWNKDLNKYEYDTTDPKYSTWVPPTDQRGDGRTSLNDKLGY